MHCPDRADCMNPDMATSMSPDRATRINPDRSTRMSLDRTTRISPDKGICGQVASSSYSCVCPRTEISRYVFCLL